jgi:opacity protein-like surface antigen
MKYFAFIVLIMGGLYVLLSPTVAISQESDAYATLKLGVYVPQSDDLEGFNEGFNGEIEFGHYYSPFFAVALNIGYFQTDATSSGTDALLGSFVLREEIAVTPITLTGRGIYPVGKFEFFAEVGGGIYYTKGKFDISSSAKGDILLIEYDTEFGYFVGAGVSVDITPKTVLGIECKYFFATAGFGAAVDGEPIRLDTDLDGLLITVTLANRFDFFY